MRRVLASWSDSETSEAMFKRDTEASSKYVAMRFLKFGERLWGNDRKYIHSGLPKWRFSIRTSKTESRWEQARCYAGVRLPWDEKENFQACGEYIAFAPADEKWLRMRGRRVPATRARMKRRLKRKKGGKVNADKSAGEDENYENKTEEEVEMVRLGATASRRRAACRGR
jgi:hypothetical protein